MELNFEKNGDMFVAEFVATSDFNLHIEKPTGAIYLFVKSVGNGKYDSVNVNIPAGDSVIDYDFIASVYPKYLKVVSEVEPSYAEVVSSGEVTEIKSQSKEVEIVSNGTTEVTPDAGYSYLSGVSVKVNVPQEGGDTPSGGGYEYLDLRECDASLKLPLVLFSYIVAHNATSSGYGEGISPSAFFRNVSGTENEVFACAIDFNAKLKMGGTEELSLLDSLIGVGFSSDQLAAIPRITEEQFYTL